MNREQVVEILREHEAELRACGVAHLRLFGSVARGAQTDASDIDIAAMMDPTQNWSGLTLGGVQMDLCDWLKLEVDFNLIDWFSPRTKDRITREGIDVF
jgi:hypothetical protein